VASDSLDWLYGLAQFGIKFGLGNIRAVLAGLDHPHQQFRSLHVAGTNGKGSVTAIVDAALRHAGYRVGRYTSPHLLDLSERFVIGGEPVSQEDMLDAVEAVRATVARLQTDGTLDVHPTFFEVTTAVAFELFRRHRVDVAVCEVGLGGRLDATNVLTPVTTAITSIAFDHEQHLGHTLREIAMEKAGIIKPGVPVVVGPVPDEAADAIRGIATERGAPLVTAMDGITLGPVSSASAGSQTFDLQTGTRRYGPVRLALAGAHQVTNAVVAVRLLEETERSGVPIGSQAIIDALASVRWPGRLDHRRLADGTDVLLDAAHNAAGAAQLAAYLRALPEKRTLVFSAMRDKDATAMLQALLPTVARVVVTRASNPRANDPDVLAQLARRLAPTLHIDIQESPAVALARATAAQTPVVVAGSIFLLADVLREIGRS
jgi:dihydrofolate synthase/folylpolyglutamate synthase